MKKFCLRSLNAVPPTVTGVGSLYGSIPEGILLLKALGRCLQPVEGYRRSIAIRGPHTQNQDQRPSDARPRRIL